jgi:hypothetical protein
MRARHVFLALLIIICGLIINASQRGLFTNLNRYWQKIFSSVPGVAIQDLSEQALNTFPGDWRQVKRNEQTIAPQDADRIVIDNPYGHVFVTGKLQKAINLETVKWGRARTLEEALRNSDSAQLQIVRTGRELNLKVTGPPDYSRKAQIDIYLTLPQKFSLQGDSVIGTFHIEDLQGDLKLSTINTRIEILGGNKIEAGSVNGDIEVDDASGPVSLENKNGDITINNATGAIEASNVGGGIQGNDIRGPIDLSTISGQINLARFSGAKGRLETTSGEITAGVTGHYAGKLSAKNVSGPIRLELPGNINCLVKLDTVSGEISNPLPLIDEEAKANALAGRFGDGRGEISASTVSGAVSLEKAASYFVAPH